MIEKVNPAHCDKMADRIAGAIVDLAYASEMNPKIAVEVLIGHGNCHIIIETDAQIDIADSVTGRGLHGKDLSKAHVSVNIHAFLKAKRLGTPVELCCAIGDAEVDGIPYSEIVAEAGSFIRPAGSFEKFAEWGLV